MRRFSPWHRTQAPLARRLCPLHRHQGRAWRCALDRLAAGAARPRPGHAGRVRPCAWRSIARDHACRQFRAAVFWRGMRAEAAQRGIQLFGDMPIFVAHDSADVWAQRELFLLDADGHPTVVAGVPPDYFSETGQRWGNPHYNWAAMQADGFAWWRARLRAHFEWFDWVRIDHFRGLAAAWTIPASEPTAIHGQWVASPGAALLQAVARRNGRTWIWWPKTWASSRRMSPRCAISLACPAWLFCSLHLTPMPTTRTSPKTCSPTPCITPARMITIRYWAGGAHCPSMRVSRCWQLGSVNQHAVSDERIVDAMIATVLHSRAALAVLPLQDVLHLGSEARMNTPGTDNGNWTWRFDWDDLPRDLASRLLEQIKKSHRSGNCHLMKAPLKASPQADLPAISEPILRVQKGTHHDPFEVLGAHRRAGRKHGVASLPAGGRSRRGGWHAHDAYSGNRLLRTDAATRSDD